MKLRNIRNTHTGVTTFGVMWAENELSGCDDGKLDDVLQCVNSNGDDVLMQSRITAYWPNGSVKWTAHTARVDKLGDKIEVKKRKANCKRSRQPKLAVAEFDNHIHVKSGSTDIYIDRPVNGKFTANLFERVTLSNEIIWMNAHPVLKLEEHSGAGEEYSLCYKSFNGRIEKVTCEAKGCVETVIKYEGIHEASDGSRKIPFVIRMYISMDAGIKFAHTFMYDGDEDVDYLKGIGISLDVKNEGCIYNRHVKFMEQYGVFHEALLHLQSWRPHLDPKLMDEQVKGHFVEPPEAYKDDIKFVVENSPIWSEYDLCQDSVSHYVIKKKLSGEDLTYIEARHGLKTQGGAAVASNIGSTMFAIRDFWEKYPTGYSFKNMDGDFTNATMWFWSPQAASMDFRHYAKRGYNQVCYEGYDYKGAEPVGIACTSECAISFKHNVCVSDKDLTNFASALNAPALYVAKPEVYHELKAFGYWSLPGKKNETEKWIENQLAKAFSFYQNEVSQRNWYGMFDYGDFMHTYDEKRHVWKYDVGGYAWDNTELVPTLWLWLYFLRTGREDVFTLAEKLSRHASEVDVYHFGKYKGLGSRHNVRHWGCPCKEARIAMAGHHRYLYYLTGDRRLEDIFDELKDNELSFLNKDPLGDFFDKKDMVFPSHARSGPDWSSLVSNWMTEWERHKDNTYRDKIMVGIEDIAAAPLKLSSGPDFEFDPKTVHLRYIGERTTGGCHLQVCMGAPSIWMETADLLDCEEFKKMIADHGRFYFLPKEQQLKESGGIIGNRQSSLPMLSCAMGAYGAKYLNDKWLADTTWKILLATMIQGDESKGFVPTVIKDTAGVSNLNEIKWVTTNFTAQWCLNAIMTLEFIRDDLPETLDGVRELVKDTNPSVLHVS